MGSAITLTAVTHVHVVKDIQVRIVKASIYRVTQVLVPTVVLADREKNTLTPVIALQAFAVQIVKRTSIIVLVTNAKTAANALMV